MKCRCDILNVMTGEPALEYAREHLDEVRSNTIQTSHYRCPVTGITWVEERSPLGLTEDSRRLRRVDPSKV